MSVYVVTCGSYYEDTYVLGVYATEESAKNAIKEDKKGDDNMDWYDVTKWEVEKGE